MVLQIGRHGEGAAHVLAPVDVQVGVFLRVDRRVVVYSTFEEVLVVDDPALRRGVSPAGSIVSQDVRACAIALEVVVQLSVVRVR